MPLLLEDPAFWPLKAESGHTNSFWRGRRGTPKGIREESGSEEGGRNLPGLLRPRGWGAVSMPPPPHPAVPTTDSRGPSRRSAVLTQPRSRPTASTQAPAVFPLVSCCEGTSTAALSVTLGCLVRDYFPGPVTVTWDVGTLNKNTVTFPATLHSTSNLYTTTSQVTASGEWATQKFTCQVEHPGSAAISRSFRGESGGPTHSRGATVRRGRPAGGSPKAAMLVTPRVPGALGWGVGFHRLRGQHHTRHLRPQCAPRTTPSPP